MKKRLSVLASLALCVTVGGVYATWIYATQEVPTAYATMGVTLTGTSQGGQAGTLTIAGSNVDLTIDDVATDTELHKATLVYETTGYFTITFTPNDNAEADIRDGVSIDWSIGLYDTAKKQSTTADQWKFEDTESNGQKVTKQIFTIDTATTTIKEGTANGWTVKDGVYTYKLALTEVMKKITLNKTLYLSTVEEYNAFKTALLGYEFHVHAALTPGQAGTPTQNQNQNQ